MKRVLIAAIAAVSVSAWTQQAMPQGNWEKEPETFLGIRLGDRFMVPACPTKDYGSRQVPIVVVDYGALSQVQGVCFNPSLNVSSIPSGDGPGSYRLENIPNLGVEYSISVRVNAGVSERIVMRLKQSGFEVLLDAFMQRYGQPTQISSGVAKNLGGAELQSRQVEWLGRNLSIRMYERHNTMDESHIEVSSNAIASREAESVRTRRASELQKF